MKLAIHGSKCLSLLLLGAGLMSCAPTTKGIPAGVKSSPAMTTEEAEEIRTGAALHDAGRFDQALATYRSVLTRNPDQVVAIYEVTNTLCAKQAFRECVTESRRGLEYQSPLRAKFLMMMANCQDNMGHGTEALQAYQAAVAADPGNSMIHYNYGVALFTARDASRAKEEFKAAVILNPEHASSHFALAETYAGMGYTIPALLAYWRFLVLENGSRRSDVARDRIKAILDAKVGRKGDGSIVLSLDRNEEKAGEGDYGMIDLMLTMSGALAFDTSSGAKALAGTPEIENKALLKSLDDFLKAKKHPGFIWDYYIPYFADISRRGFEKEFFGSFAL